LLELLQPGPFSSKFSWNTAISKQPVDKSSLAYGRWWT